MIHSHAHSHTYSKYNVLAQPTQPMNIADSVLNRLAGLSIQQQWIFFTAECPRPNHAQFSASNVRCQKIIQLKSSNSQSELEIVIKAIQSGNASAVVASNQIDSINQSLLQNLAQSHGCEVFFVEGRVNQYH
ncbi:SulA-like leucine-rich domain-containing protein [Vibrio renipiscarius]|uniref:50S ribosomal protein L7ae n=1 Tax=Vibrio renipiscarius TaxID=1461322 RepID=A0A0C2KFH5_9VIBR|nr:SulA-like leucine-rich domain-containing protein [Vibrio renipiscarius]KII79433.1 50S ribosomal protein L7ae [Vibrio renipiscarius]KII80938.1 50S ribosomal protein L7ae [Vibrio renipiscarius]